MITQELDNYVGTLNSLLKSNNTQEIEAVLKETITALKFSAIKILIQEINDEKGAELLHEIAALTEKLLDKKAFKYAGLFKEMETKLKAKYVKKYKRPVPPFEKSSFELKENTIIAYLSKNDKVQNRIIQIIRAAYPIQQFSTEEGALQFKKHRLN